MRREAHLTSGLSFSPYLAISRYFPSLDLLHDSAMSKKEPIDRIPPNPVMGNAVLGRVCAAHITCLQSQPRVPNN